LKLQLLARSGERDAKSPYGGMRAARLFNDAAHGALHRSRTRYALARTIA